MSRPAPDVLLIEDERPLRETLSAFLEDEGYRVVAARDGHEAIGALVREVPRLVLLDLMMPGMSGEETLGAMRAIEARLPVVLLSAHHDIAGEARRLGTVGYLSKPFDLDDVLSVVDYWCRQQWGRDTA